ncbi:MAG: sensor histidine kinase [Brevundimonas sp.]
MSLNDVALARLIIENVRSHGIIGLAPDGHITAWAAGAETITGYTREDALGMDFAELFTPADQAAGMPRAEIDTAMRTGRAEDSRWHQRKDGSLFWGNGVTVDLHAGGILAKIFRDETGAKQAEEQRILLLNELNHRVKNTLATVQSIAEQGLRAAGVDKSVREGLANRLIALSQAHNVLVNENWAGADLRTLICEVLAPYERTPSPIRLEGPPVRLHPSQAVSVSLACHELATNAAKYGALSTPDGRVQLDWNLAHNGDGQRFLTLLWRESGGPLVVPPTREGFGARLIRQTFEAEQGGRAQIQFPPGGAHCSLLLALKDEEDEEVPDGQPADPAPVRA